MLFYLSIHFLHKYILVSLKVKATDNDGLQHGQFSYFTVGHVIVLIETM